ncbi:DUF1176 domain-containing protein [Sphingomonas canadensis]|uniref:DUF1176 domain-containing protein n=1 Tax=Sphingomonas canadensis TaxID=1219257 RepID=A0ABW3H8G9_9SPHN|nr:DUF1176 domain-containing protein [Sphingomonas canadensis]MCW3837178.1 DUF1176 domain-containing protein [Sphingomonas canadensis]
MIRLLPLLLLTSAAPPVPERLFGDWAVTCDNVMRCEAVSLQPAARLGEDHVQVSIGRDPGPAGGLTIDIAPHATPGRAMIEIDGRPMTPAVILETGIHLEGAAAEGLARAMATGKRMTVRDYHEKRVAFISLAGSSAMLRWIDAQQGRSGTLTALVARGTKPVSAVPKAAALPSVPALRAPKGAPPRIAPDLIAAMTKQGECEELNDNPALKPEIAKLDARNTLVLIPCGSGAYNFNAAAFVVTGGKAAPAKFDTGPDVELNGVTILTNAGWSDEKGVLGHYMKGRGLGDCGGAQDWVWDGSRFRLILETRLGECRGSIDWLTVFRATPVWR